ncbi:MAG TPA: helix-turn-helix domain-containing protein [Microlunatus sp.]|nr:helix-turn-helix domain-containing protein [Microlunatus sp.]
MPGRSDTGGRTSRAFAILDTFLDHPEQTHGSITRATGFSPATVHRLLAEMVAWGAVERTALGPLPDRHAAGAAGLAGPGRAGPA